MVGIGSNMMECSFTPTSGEKRESGSIKLGKKIKHRKTTRIENDI